MDFYTNLTFKVQKGRGLASGDPISKFWDPLITFEEIEQSASDLAQSQRTAPYCVRTTKRPPNSRKTAIFGPDFDGTKFSTENRFTMGVLPCKLPLIVVVAP